MLNLKNQYSVVSIIFVFFAVLGVIALWTSFANGEAIATKAKSAAHSAKVLTTITAFRKCLDNELLVFRETLADINNQSALDESRIKIKNKLEAVRVAVADNQAQLQSADDILPPLERVLDLQNSMLEIKEKSGYEAAVVFSRNNGGIDNTRNLNNAIDKIQNEEQKLAFERSNDLDKELVAYSAIFKAVTIVGLFMFALAFVNWRRVSYLRTKTSTDLRDLANSNSEIEDETSVRVPREKLNSFADFLEENERRTAAILKN